MATSAKKSGSASFELLTNAGLAAIAQGNAEEAAALLRCTNTVLAS
jgi:hypothetical protein